MPCARISHCQRSAIGNAVPIMIATERANHHGFASSSVSIVSRRSTFQTRYATASPVRTSVAAIRVRRLIRRSGNAPDGARRSRRGCPRPRARATAATRAPRRPPAPRREAVAAPDSARGTTSAGGRGGSGCSSRCAPPSRARWYSSRVAPAASGSIRTAYRCSACVSRGSRASGVIPSRSATPSSYNANCRARISVCSSSLSSWTSAIAASTSDRFALKPAVTWS